MRYVVGFAFTHDFKVVLIRKEKPDWQAGHLNGVGGKIEDLEYPRGAMAREFREETGYYTDLTKWEHVVKMKFPDDTSLYVVTIQLDPWATVRTMESEEVVVLPVEQVLAVPPHYKLDIQSKIRHCLSVIRGEWS